MTRRTSAEEVAAFKQRCEDLFKKEARCPLCQKVRRANPMVSDDLKALVDDPSVSGLMPPCHSHARIRYDMALSGMRG